MLSKIALLSTLAILAAGHEVSLDGLGKIRGKEEVARGDKKYLSFLGIPYAEPPVGDLRWKLPVPATGWEGVRDSTEYGSSCIQYPMLVPGKLVGSEDCLVLNVHTRSLEGNKPVIVYIHGGAWRMGSAHLSAQYILQKDVVFVSIQYRLGPFGFLSTEDAEGVGNYGLHDQHLALKWIQQHISKFGGNKDLVTVTGMSAGAASVHYHLLSPKSDGLFHRAMAMSGSSLCWWANLKNAKKTAVKLAEAVDCSTTSSSELLDCLRGKSAEDLMAAQVNLYAWRQGMVEAEPFTIWGPRVDAEAGDEAILPVDPTIAMKAGQIQPVPFLVGIADSEGAFKANWYLNKDDNMAEFLKDFDKIAPYTLGLKGNVRDDHMEGVLKKIKYYYLSSLIEEKDLDKRLKTVVSGMVRMLGDSLVNFPVDRMVKLHGNKEYAPVWMYLFNFKTNHSLAMFDAKNPGKVMSVDQQFDMLRRPTHASEDSMLFPILEREMGPLSDEETKVSKKFIKFLVDFAVKGHPTQDGKYEMRDWKPAADGELSHLIFSKYNANNVGLPYQNRMKWWSLLPVYWNKAKDLIEDATPERYAENAEEISDEPSRYAEDAEEIIDEVLINAESSEEVIDEDIEEATVELVDKDEL